MLHECDRDTCLRTEHNKEFFERKIIEFADEIREEDEYAHHLKGITLDDLTLRFEVREKIPSHDLENGGAHSGVFHFALNDLVRKGVLILMVRNGKFVLYRRGL